MEYEKFVQNICEITVRSIIQEIFHNKVHQYFLSI